MVATTSSSNIETLVYRLMWGEPALTIIDIRDPEAYRQEHILGAVMIPMPQLMQTVTESLESIRDIYLMGSDDTQLAQAAQSLRDAGYERVTELKGGIEAWKKAGGKTEGLATINTTKNN